MNKTVTTDLLKAKRACKLQVNLFHELTGGTIRLTKRWCLANADKFRWDWAALYLLTPSARAEFEHVTAAAWAEFERVRAPAWAEYERVTSHARAEYERVRAPALAEYERVRVPAGAEYKRVTAAARAEFERVTAVTFWKLYDRDAIQE